jgi:CTP synthase (UTP-ammonia lyase)
MVNYIIVTGGVVSGLGKGITTASIGKILKLHGYAKYGLQKMVVKLIRI